eukprot:4513681-Pyramimonas_sp.AAC.1
MASLKAANRARTIWGLIGVGHVAKECCSTTRRYDSSTSPAGSIRSLCTSHRCADRWSAGTVARHNRQWSGSVNSAVVWYGGKAAYGASSFVIHCNAGSAPDHVCAGGRESRYDALSSCTNLESTAGDCPAKQGLQQCM